jgi:hypothetical protein
MIEIADRYQMQRNKALCCTALSGLMFVVIVLLLTLSLKKGHQPKDMPTAH